MRTADTIYALASGRGKAGVAVVRMSGPHAREAVAHLTKCVALAPRVASLVTLAQRVHSVRNSPGAVEPLPTGGTPSLPPDESDGGNDGR